MLQVNEKVLDEVLKIYKARQGEEHSLPWDMIVARARAEIACLVEDDVERILSQEELPELRAAWRKRDEHIAAQPHLSLIQRFVRKYCQIRQDRIRDSRI